MLKIISLHSFRGGTGKSNTTANIAALLAADGRRVGVVDTDIQSPGIHILFGLAGEQVSHTLNDYLWGKCDIAQTAHDVSSCLGTSGTGKIYLIPSSIRPGEITRVLREGYDPQLLTTGFRQLIDELGLDALFIDTHPGLGEQTLLSIVISHTLVIILRPDQQDYEGTGVTVQVARRLKVPNMVLVVNKVPSVFDAAAVKAQVERAYGCPVIAILPHSEELMTLASGGIFALRNPDSPLTTLYRQAAAMLMEPG
ncbi:MAG: MinD/ParA family protein [Anaerolineales bacterium]|jgi:MinD-like ATPase involved in chromosome partitioning or flagellar assembly